MEAKQFRVEFEGSVLVLKVDLNKDGESSVEVRLPLTEIVEEIGYKLIKKDE